MSNNTFQFLDNQSGELKSEGNPAYSAPDAAQDFLKEKLNNNRWLDVTNPDNPYSLGEGKVVSGPAYEKQAKMLNEEAVLKSQEESAASKGKLSAEQIREKFGLGFNEEHAKQSHSNVQKGSDVANTGALYVKGEYIGTINGFSSQDPDELHPGAGGIGDLQAIDQYAYDNGLKEKMSTGWNSYNDVANAVRSIHGKEVKEVKPIYEEDQKIEHSEKIREAKTRVQDYEQNVLSGETSEDIFGNSGMGRYKFDPTQGIKAFGFNTDTSSPTVSEESAKQATQSFLDKKVDDTKNKYKFEAPA